MKLIWKILASCLLLIPFLGTSQYTDVINSNRPGVSVSAFSVGRNVVQGEFALGMDKQEHDRLLAKSNIFNIDFALRYGLLFEELELSWEGSYLFDKLTDNSALPPTESNRNGFSRHTFGVKYLFFDPFKNPENNKPNLYSWRANNGFKWKDLIPAISAYVGVNINIFDSPYVYNNVFSTTSSNFIFHREEPTISPKVMIATQSHLAGTWVVVTNFAYDKIGSDYPEFSYALAVTHALKNPKWSLFVEYQGVKSDRYADALVRGGAAYLWNKNFQLDASMGTNFKNTPSRLFGNLGISYRLDFHQDQLKAIDEGKERRRIKKEQRKRKKKKDHDSLPELQEEG